MTDETIRSFATLKLYDLTSDDVGVVRADIEFSEHAFKEGDLMPPPFVAMQDLWNSYLQEMASANTVEVEGNDTVN